jgi:hypothetical protein
MSTYEVDYALLDENPYFDLLGYNGDAVFVRHARGGSVFKLRGTLNEWMLSFIAPLAWWQEVLPKGKRGMPASSAFVRAAFRKGFYDEVGIAQRRIADEKRAAQAAPVMTENGLPVAFVVKETKTHLHVKCPFCGDVHVHGAPLLGPRLPHCRPLYPGIGDYELVRRSVASTK